MGRFDFRGWGRPNKQAKLLRTAEEFDLARLAAELRTPSSVQSAFAWMLGQIYEARDQQLRGNFRRPTELSDSFGADDALYTARRNRLAPLRALGVTTTPADDTAESKKIAAEADALYGKNGIAFTLETQESILKEVVDHGLGVGWIKNVPRDGVRHDFYVHHWPLRWVRYDSTKRQLVTQIDSMHREGIEAEKLAGALSYAEVPIVHGDGRWVVFTKRETEPWKGDACLIPAALIWGMRAFALRDWAQNARAHGAAKMFGELPVGIDLTDEAGVPTAQAAAFLRMMQDVMTGDTMVGIRPAGSKTDFTANASTNWQIFAELVGDRSKAAARIYQGTDGALGAQGGAPGVDISALFGLATTIMQGDARCINEGFHTGVMQPWAAANFGDSKRAPRRLFDLPDPDAETYRENFASREAAFHTAVESYRKNGFEITPEIISELARRFAVPAPKLPDEAKRAPSIALAPTDLATAVSVNEARASAGLGRLQKPATLGGGDDPDGDLPLSAYRAKVEAAQKPPAPAAPTP